MPALLEDVDVRDVPAEVELRLRDSQYERVRQRSRESACHREAHGREGSAFQKNGDSRGVCHGEQAGNVYKFSWVMFLNVLEQKKNEKRHRSGYGRTDRSQFDNDAGRLGGEVL